LRKQIMKRIVCSQNNFVGLRLLGTFNCPCLFVLGPIFSFIGQPDFLLQEVMTVEDMAKKINKQSKQSNFFIFN